MLFSIYAIVMGIYGTFFLPCNLVYGYGDDVQIMSAEFVPIWILIDKTKLINDNYPRYELILSRAIYTFAFMGLFVFILYLLFDKTGKNKSKHDEDM